MKVFKIFGIIVVIIIALIVVIGIYVAKNIDSIVKESVETYGSQMTGTQVKLNSVDIKPTQASANLKGFSVANPKGYSSSTLFALDGISFDIDTSRIKDKIVNVQKMVISGVSITAEQKELTTNIQTMLKRISAGDTKAEPESNKDPIDIRFAIKSLVFNEGNINLVTEKYGDYAITIPSFQLSNIGSPNVGLTPQQLSVAIMKPLLKQAEDAAKNKLQEIAEDKAKEKIKDKLKDKLNSKFSDEKQKEIKEKLEGVKNLFGN